MCRRVGAFADAPVLWPERHAFAGVNRPVAAVLEGGYAPALIAEASSHVIHAMLGIPPPSPDSIVLCDDCNCEDSSEEEESDFEDVNGKLIVALDVLDAVRRRLNTLPPWNKGPADKKLFHEGQYPARAKQAAADLAAHIATCDEHVYTNSVGRQIVYERRELL